MGGKQSSVSIEESGNNSSNNVSTVQDSTALDDFLVCQLCKEEFNLQIRIGKFLDCHHTFCLLCLRVSPLNRQHHINQYIIAPLLYIDIFCLSNLLERKSYVRINADSVQIFRAEQLTSWLPTCTFGQQLKEECWAILR